MGSVYSKYLRNFYFEIFLICLVVACIQFFFLKQRNWNSVQEVCHLFQENYIELLSSEDYEDCLQQNYRLSANRRDQIPQWNQWLSNFEISHLYIYNDEENQKIWRSQSIETGIITKKIFGKWRAVKILNPESFLKVGDQLLSINGESIYSSHQVLKTEGQYSVLRNGVENIFYVPFSDIQYDESIKFKNFNSQWGYLEIPSFRSSFFGYDELSKIYSQLKGKNLFIDVRDNIGGNLVSMLRLLSMIQCDTSEVGLIFHHRIEYHGSYALKDNPSDSFQFQQISENNPVNLKLFKTELCLKPEKIIVLINQRTSSVSELFVQILKNQRKDLKVVGQKSAGRIVLSIWYPLKFLGLEVMFSIPYAWITANDKKILEGLGVNPTEFITKEELKKYKESLDPLLDFVLDKEQLLIRQGKALSI